jgi:hypothetical protein
MAIGAQVMAGGISAPAAGALLGSVATSLTAAGSTQATALALGSAINAISTAAASTGVILPSTATPGDQIFIYNGGANTVTVYPAVGGTLNNLSANTGFSVATLKSCICVNTTGLGWAVMLGA